MDRTLRELERAALHGGLQAQARLLTQRVRSGDLTWERLRLAAYLDDPASRLAVDRHAPTASKYSGRWIRGLARFGEGASREAVLTTHRLVLEQLELRQAPMAKLVKTALEAAEADHQDARRLVQIAEQAWFGDEPYYRTDGARNRRRWWPIPRLFLTDVLFGRAVEAVGPSFREAVNQLKDGWSRHAKRQAEGQVRDALARTLVPWALR